MNSKVLPCYKRVPTDMLYHRFLDVTMWIRILHTFFIYNHKNQKFFYFGYIISSPPKAVNVTFTSSHDELRVREGNIFAKISSVIRNSEFDGNFLQAEFMCRRPLNSVSTCTQNLPDKQRMTSPPMDMNLSSRIYLSLSLVRFAHS